MKTLSYSLTSSPDETQINALKQLDPSVIFLFFAPSVVASPAVLHKLSSLFPEIPVVGCSTAGEISNDGLHAESISLLAIHFDKTKVRAVSADVSDAAGSYDRAFGLAQQLSQSDLKAIFVLSPGMNINGSEVVRGFSRGVEQGKDITIFGGLAGDEMSFGTTYTFEKGQLATQRLLAVGFYGDSFEVKCASRGGWMPFGPSRRVTRAEGNVLYELDGKPALELYKQYLGDKADKLPSSGLLYPFAILKDDQSQSGLIRTILDINHETNSLTLAGDIPQGQFVCLMHADIDQLIDGARDAAEQACLNEHDPKSSAAFLVSCVGRKIVMSDETVEEIEAVKDVLGVQTAIAGFYSYGEISMFFETKESALHNQTMTIMHLSEAA